MRQNQIETLRAEPKNLLPFIGQLEQQMHALDDEYHADKELRHLARLLYSLNEQHFCQFLTENKNTLQKPTVK